MEKKKIAIGIPVGAYFDPDFGLSLASICYHRSDLYDLMAVYNSRGCYIDMNRNRIVEMFFEKDEADWLLMLDTDLSFEKSLIEGLCKLADETNSKVVAGWYITMYKHGGMRPLLYRLDPGGFINMFPNMDDSPTKVDGIATGCLMVHKEVYKNVRRDTTNRIFYFSDTALEFENQPSHDPLGEDLTFSMSCKKAGYDIYTRKSLRLSHHKIRKH